MTLPELLSSAEALSVLGIRSRSTLARIRVARPEVAVVVPGMRQPRYRRAVLLAWLDSSRQSATPAPGIRGPRPACAPTPRP